MDSVAGSSIGLVDRQRQGTGLATILPSDNTSKFAEVMWAQNEAERKRKAAEAAQKKAASLDKLLNFAPEYWYKHDSEMKKMQNSFVEDGAKLMLQGIQDPFSGADTKSVEFRKQYARLDQMAKMSKQLEKAWEAGKSALVGGKDADYTADSISAFQKFFDKPLSEIVDKNLTPPALMKRTPGADAFSMIGKAVTPYVKQRGDVPLTDAEAHDFIMTWGMQPENKEQVSQAYSYVLGSMPKEQQDAIKERAKNNGEDVWVTMATDDAIRWNKRNLPFKPLEELQKAAKLVEGGLKYVSTSTPDKYATFYKKDDLKKGIDVTAPALFREDPYKWQQYYSSQGITQDPNESEQEYHSRIVDAMKRDLVPLIGTKTASGTTEHGTGKIEMEKGQNLFLQHMVSGDIVKQDSAAKWLIGTTYSGNLKVEKANVRPGLAPEGGQVLELAITTPESEQVVKQKVAAASGVSEDQVSVIDKQGQKEVSINLTGPGGKPNQILLNLYDARHKQTGSNYQGEYTEHSPQTALDPQVVNPVIQGKVAPPVINKGVKSITTTKAGVGLLNNFFGQ